MLSGTGNTLSIKQASCKEWKDYSLKESSIIIFFFLECLHQQSRRRKDNPVQRLWQEILFTFCKKISSLIASKKLITSDELHFTKLRDTYHIQKIELTCYSNICIVKIVTFTKSFNNPLILARFSHIAGVQYISMEK